MKHVHVYNTFNFLTQITRYMYMYVRIYTKIVNVTCTCIFCTCTYCSKRHMYTTVYEVKPFSFQQPNGSNFKHKPAFDIEHMYLTFCSELSVNTGPKLGLCLYHLFVHIRWSYIVCGYFKCSKFSICCIIYSLYYICIFNKISFKFAMFRNPMFNNLYLYCVFVQPKLLVHVNAQEMCIYWRSLSVESD